MSSRDTPIERMPVVILAGGMGTRLREETERVPKPLVQIGERPILWHIMKLYGHHAARRFVVCLGYKSWSIKEYFLRYHEQLADVTVHIGNTAPPRFHGNPIDEDWEVTLAETGLETGTGGRIHRVRRYVDTDTFILTYGDGLGSVDISALVDFHRSHGRIGTVTGVHPTSRYGEMKVADGASPDKRSYRVSFAKVAAQLPGFEPQWTVQKGIEEVYEAYKTRGLGLDDFRTSRFQRIKRVLELKDAGLLDDDLRWLAGVKA